MDTVDGGRDHLRGESMTKQLADVIERLLWALENPEAPAEERAEVVADARMVLDVARTVMA